MPLSLHYSSRHETKKNKENEWAVQEKETMDIEYTEYLSLSTEKSVVRTLYYWLTTATTFPSSGVLLLRFPSRLFCSFRFLCIVLSGYWIDFIHAFIHSWLLQQTHHWMRSTFLFLGKEVTFPARLTTKVVSRGTKVFFPGIQHKSFYERTKLRQTVIQ